MNGFMKVFTAAFLFLALAVAGCGGGAAVKKDDTIQGGGAPEWVVKGSGAFGGERGRVFYGIGVASNIQNIALLRNSADNRARNEVAKVFQVYTASLAKDYMASTSGTDKDATSEEQHVENAVKTVTAATLHGVEIVDHWQNPKSGELYALARLDLNAFKDSLDKVKELDSKVRDYIRGNAERMHDQLEKEEAKIDAKNAK